MAGAVAVPERATTSGEFAALLVTVTLPERFPAAAGANETLKEVDCPAEREIGKAIALLVNPVPLSVICEMEMAEFPVLVSVRV